MSTAAEREMRPEAAAVTAPTNVLIVGVGGQGVITVSKILAQLCLHNKLNVKQSEIHGMAKRGGAVFSHVRFGSEVYSPTIPLGQADILLALEWAEGLRWLPYLNAPAPEPLLPTPNRLSHRFPTATASAALPRTTFTRRWLRSGSTCPMPLP